MSCFLSCFGGSKNRRRRSPPRRKLAANRVHVSEKSGSPLRSASPENLAAGVVDGPHSVCSPAEEVAGEVLVESPCERRDEVAVESSPTAKKRVTFDLNVKSYEDEGVVNEESEHEEAEKGDEKPIKEAAFPANHRYQNCEGSDDELGSDYEDCELSGDEDEDVVEGNEESYDSFFSQSVNGEKKGLCEAESPEPKTPVMPVVSTKLVRDRSQYVHSVLNPVENLTQWKEVKGRAGSVKCLDKENVELDVQNKVASPAITPKPIVEARNSRASPRCSPKQEVSVDASLSTWLVSSDNSTVDGPQESYSRLSNSSVSREERPILGALTMDDIRYSSATSTPRRSPSKSPDETPIVGIVGSYWNPMMISDGDSAPIGGTGKSYRNPVMVRDTTSKGIPNTTSKYREDRRVNWHSTPFEVRLERALESEPGSA